MKPQAVHVHIGRLVLDASLGANPRGDALAGALKGALTFASGQGAAANARQSPTAVLAQTVAAGIGERLDAMGIDAGLERARGRDG